MSDIAALAADTASAALTCGDDTVLGGGLAGSSNVTTLSQKTARNRNLMTPFPGGLTLNRQVHPSGDP